VRRRSANLLHGVPLVVAALASALAGCATEPDDAGCGSLRPSLASCFRGLYWADCGGSGDPALACSELDGSCLWFTHGCVASAYRPIGCPVENVCCESSSAGPWPYPDDWRPADMTQRLAEDVALFGAMPITRESPADIVVVADEAIVAPVAPTASCTEGLDLQLCDDASSFPIMMPDVRFVGDAIVVTLRNRFRHVQDLIVEIVPNDDGSGGIARVFLRLQSDLLREEPVCAVDYVELPEQSGTMVVSSFAPTASQPLHATLELSVADRGTMAIEF
jgi:hypothetical protein